MMIVIDVSAAIEMLRETTVGLGLKELMLPHEEAVAPNVFHAESANVLWEYACAGLIDKEECVERFEECVSLVDRFVPDDQLMPEALSEGVRLQHPVHDMLYFVLARREAATLFTNDRRLMRLCADNGVNVVELVDF